MLKHLKALSACKKMFNRRPLIYWFLGVFIFYAIWFAVCYMNSSWVELFTYWPIALSMALGSYAAGSTPMGGGSIGFPVLVFIFDYPVSFGRDFSFAIQSIGMVSASLFILCRKQILHVPILSGAMLGSLVGTPLGLVFIAPVIPDILAKIIFSVIWASFGVLHLYRMKEICQQTDNHRDADRTAFILGVTLGLFSGAFIVSVTGVGIDMMTYILLMLFFRCDLKIAIPTSVVIMAFTSVVGIAFRSTFQTIDAGTFENWLAAAPIVVIGAPLGVFVVEKAGRASTLLVIAFLCISQFLWINYSEYNHLGLSGVIFLLVALVFCVMGFELLRYLGLRRTVLANNG